MTLKWRIYYGDGTTFDSSQGDPMDTPGRDVQVIAMPDPDVGRILLHLWDWYYYWPETGQWWGSDQYGVLDLLTSRKPIEAISAGRQCPRFKEIYQTARFDPDFPVKSADHKKERP